MKLKWTKYLLYFKQPAGTSRGVMQTRICYYFLVDLQNGYKAIGECAPLFGLSPEDPKTYEQQLDHVVLNAEKFVQQPALLEQWPSIRFGLEMLLRDIAMGNQHILFDSRFVRNETGIDINGLIWMGSVQFMKDQIATKLKTGWRCLKLKIGARDFEEEIILIKNIRKEYHVDDLEIRLDANGAFGPYEALEKLKRLEGCHIHSIEQPIRPGQPEEMARLCEWSPIDIALDEELIGHYGTSRKELLEIINPQYVIFKPTLLGGWQATNEWIDQCKRHGIQWWITSALESNVGLSAIAQWTATLGRDMPQGLGTGLLYTNNIESPLFMTPGNLHYDPEASWCLEYLWD